MNLWGSVIAIGVVCTFYTTIVSMNSNYGWGKGRARGTLKILGDGKKKRAIVL